MFLLTEQKPSQLLSVKVVSESRDEALEGRFLNLFMDLGHLTKSVALNRKHSEEVVLHLRLSEDRRRGFQRAAPSVNLLYKWASENQCQKFMPQYEQDDLILIFKQNRLSEF